VSNLSFTKSPLTYAMVSSSFFSTTKQELPTLQMAAIKGFYMQDTREEQKQTMRVLRRRKTTMQEEA